jgi:ABC-2 type transport system permease protein
MRDKFRYGVGSALTLVLILAILLVLNLISVNLFARLDLTEGKVYSLSKASKSVVRSLNDRLIIKMYFTKDLPPPYNSYARYLKDKLEEYQAYAGGKLKLEMIDPAEEGKETEAQRYGIPPLQVNAMENDKIEIKKVYMGIVLLFEDKKETIPVVQNISGLEYELTSTIKRISTMFLPSVGFLVGKDGPNLDNDLSILNQALSRHYRVNRINLDEGDRIPAEVRVLVILGPKREFTTWEKFGIDQYLMKGGKLALLLNHIDVNIQEGSAQRQNLDIDDFLASYGIKINDDLVIDWQCNRIAVTQKQGIYTVQNIMNYPYFPLTSNFNQDNLMVKDLEAVGFNYVSSLDSDPASDKGFLFEPIVLSSKNSGTQKAPFDINPMRKFAPEDFTEGPLVLAAALKGSFKSYFADMDLSELETEIGYVDSLRAESPDNRLMVVADADFILDKNVRGNDNLAFFLNMVDWLTQDEALISIRSRQVTTRPLKEISPAGRKLVKYGNTFGLPFLVIVFGVVRWQIRKKIRRKDINA